MDAEAQTYVEVSDTSTSTEFAVDMHVDVNVSDTDASIVALLLSDSMFKAVQEKHGPNYKIFVLANSGETLTGLAQRLRFCDPGSCGFVILNHGINYSWQGVKVQQMVAELNEISKWHSDHPFVKLIYIKPPFVPTLTMRENLIVKQAAKLIMRSGIFDCILTLPHVYELSESFNQYSPPHWLKLTQKLVLQWVADELKNIH